MDLFEDEGENVSALRFGEDFENVQCLTNAEVAIILEKRKADHESQDMNITPAFQKTLTYVKRFSNTKDDVSSAGAATQQLRSALESFERTGEKGEELKLHPYEIAAMANLMQVDCNTEEAIALIPSLGTRFTEEDLDSILEIIRKCSLLSG